MSRGAADNPRETFCLRGAMAQTFPSFESKRVKARANHIRRRNWIMWAWVFLLVLGLGAAVPLLYLPLVGALNVVEPGSGPSSEQVYYAIVGLAGLVAIFCLYLALKQRELEGMRETLVRESQETEQVRTRLLELSAMFHLSTTLNLQLKLPVVLEIIVRRVVSALRAQQASIMLFNPESGELETRAAYGLESEFTRGARVKFGSGIAGRVAESGEPALLNRSNDDTSFTQHYKSDRNITSALSLPLRVGERCIGVLNVNRINHPELFEDHHREILTMFSEHVAAVIERAEVLDRLGSRSRELEEANVRLTELNAMKDVFLSTASHELKTPLTSVIAYAELLDDQGERLDGNQRSDFLHRLRTEAGRLMGLIEDILDLTRLESGKMTLKPITMSVRDVVHAAVETSRALAGKTDVKLVEQFEDGLPHLPLDDVKMGQVITNMIGNAVKFSPRGATVAVRVLREPRWVRIDVADEGPGVNAEEAAHIFELFGQGTSGGERPDAGVGIGLHLVKRISELHGGHVGVISQPGEGSTFWVRLPVPLSRSIDTEQLYTAA